MPRVAASAPDCHRTSPEGCCHSEAEEAVRRPRDPPLQAGLVHLVTAVQPVELANPALLARVMNERVDPFGEPSLLAAQPEGGLEHLARAPQREESSPGAGDGKDQRQCRVQGEQHEHDAHEEGAVGQNVDEEAAQAGLRARDIADEARDQVPGLVLPVASARYSGNRSRAQVAHRRDGEAREPETLQVVCQADEQHEPEEGETHREHRIHGPRPRLERCRACAGFGNPSVDDGAEWPGKRDARRHQHQARAGPLEEHDPVAPGVRSQGVQHPRDRSARGR